MASKYRISVENLRYHGLENIYVAGQTFFEETLTRRVSP